MLFSANIQQQWLEHPATVNASSVRCAAPCTSMQYVSSCTCISAYCVTDHSCTMDFSSLCAAAQPLSVCCRLNRKLPKKDNKITTTPILSVSLCCRAGSSLDPPEQCDGRGIWSSFLPCRCFSAVTGPAGGEWGGQRLPSPAPSPSTHAAFRSTPSSLHCTPHAAAGNRGPNHAAGGSICINHIWYSHHSWEGLAGGEPHQCGVHLLGRSGAPCAPGGTPTPCSSHPGTCCSQV